MKFMKFVSWSVFFAQLNFNKGYVDLNIMWADATHEIDSGGFSDVIIASFLTDVWSRFE